MTKHKWLCFPVLFLSLSLLSLPGSVSHAIAADDEEGFVSLFDGKTLKGWDGNPQFWSVKDGAITGQTTKDNPTKGNTFIIWRDGKPGDFDLRLKFHIEGGNSGVQYRSKEVAKWVLSGYQADFDAANQWAGTLYEEKGRGVLARRGDKVVIHKDGEKGRVGKTASEQEILDAINEGWNDYRIVADGNHLQQWINGVKTVDVTDEQTEKRAESGLLGLQLHAGPPMLVQFKDIRLKRLGEAAKEAPSKSDGAARVKKKVIFVAGTRSHGYGSHEHYAGCVLLAKALENAMPNFETDVYRNGWPKEEGAFDGADAVVMYADGGGRHPVIPHLKEMDALADQGVGVACLHYAVEIPKGEAGDHLLDWIGGYFEAHWSVNPHWRAEFTSLPEHPITRGVEPFDIQDEWYYHMRFREGMKGVTPILTAVPPASTLSRPDGAHSGNPHVRKKIGQPQHVAWAAERPDGGRGFGFTGGHFHWNWGDENFRKVVLNAIVWIAKGEVPQGGADDTPVTLKELEENQDYDPPQNFNRQQIREQYNLKADASTKDDKSARRSSAKPVFVSPLVTPSTKGHSTPISADISGAEKLYLVVTDGGNGYSCDWADWAEPRLVGPSGEKKLTELKWKNAQTDFGKVQVNRNVQGQPLRIDGRSVEYGVGTHANSVIEYDLPSGYTHFKAIGGLDNGGTDQGSCGAQSSVKFAVYTERPPAAVATGRPEGSREPEDAVDGLEVADGLEATLFASEPDVLSLTNLDVDHRGRVWACEVVNYRKHAGTREEGDRILILEDTDADGRADKTKVYYQGRDIDSAMGICVLGNQVIVSATPTIWVFTDLDGDDKPDRKEALFTNTGQPQHDHSAHSFLFGPDGKLYWNFGNTGKHVHDRHGKIVVDESGNPVVDNGNPYFGGMPFRCNLDGSEFEVLAHNFRNNYEVTVDSFGSLWQSDNDDDGNRAVRINYIIEHGNYGYRDEMTGASWKTERTGMAEDIPTRHWHQNDPGVVPNLLQTGAGSPTGITVYEGRLLPEVFWDEVIHCDAGPNIVRAYPVIKKGAGYRAKIADIAEGVQDKWFRPADVCVAPDGSLFVTDWYDPGVGGHNMQDLQRGRLFRIAPPDYKYTVPKFDFTTIQGAIEALKNPNYAVRFRAWQALHDEKAAAEPALRKMFETAENPRHRARALWLLGKIPVRGVTYVDQAATDPDADIRVTAVRLARQIGYDLISLVERLKDDPSAAVRRGCLIALRHHPSDRMPQLWADLAVQHDGNDRWYLEALGIGAHKHWDECLAAWLAKVDGNWNTPAGRDIIWRSRADETPQHLAKIIADESTSSDELLRYFRAFDFLPGPETDQVIQDLAFAPDAGANARQALIVSEAVQRLKPFDLSKNPAGAKALNRVLERLRGRSEYVELVSKFSYRDKYDELLTLAQANPTDQLGVEAVRTLLAKGETDLLAGALAGDDLKTTLATVDALGAAADNKAVRLLMPLIRNDRADLEVRRQATQAAARSRAGAQRLIQLAKSGELDERLKPAAAGPLNSIPFDDVRKEVARLFPLPPPKDGKPLPPIAQLVKQKGDAAHGKMVFEKTGQCAKCHVVNKEGKEVGPDLTLIGDKLSKTAFYESILFPSAGVSHNYETYTITTLDGNILTGLLVSKTDEEVAIKGDDAIVRRVDTSEIEELRRSNISLMPANLQQTMTSKDLVDVVEYLTTLKK